MLSIVTNCQIVSNDLELFITKFTEPQTIEEFESLELNTINSTINYLKVDWITNMTQSMKMCLRHVGKGWFDLSQQDYYIYHVMKLRRVMDLIKQRMQVIIAMYKF